MNGVAGTVWGARCGWWTDRAASDFRIDYRPDKDEAKKEPRWFGKRGLSASSVLEEAATGHYLADWGRGRQAIDHLRRHSAGRSSPEFSRIAKWLLYGLGRVRHVESPLDEGTDVVQLGEQVAMERDCVEGRIGGSCIRVRIAGHCR